MAEGRCNCSGIKISIPKIPSGSGICYCSNCKRTGGGMGMLGYGMDIKNVTIEDPNGLLKSYEDTDTKSGNPVVRQFCGTCGSPILTVLPSYGSMVFVTSGLFGQAPPPRDILFDENRDEWLSVAKKEARKAVE